MILYKNTKAMIHSMDDDSDFFDIFAGVLQGDILALDLFIISLYYILRTSIDLMKENGLSIKETSSRWYLEKTITDTDYTDELVLLANTPA